MQDFFTADTHLGHPNIIKYSKRPFLSVEEKEWFDKGVSFTPCAATVKLHDDTIISNINDRVGRKDRLWVLGDFSWRGYDGVSDYLNKINCDDIRLVWGNHDKRSVGSLFHSTYIQSLVVIQEQEIVICHYPMRSWDKSHHGSWNLFGHVHGNIMDIPHLLALDVGVDSHEYKPWSFDEVKEYMEKRKPAWDAHRAKWKDKDRGGMAPGSHE